MGSRGGGAVRKGVRTIFEGGTTAALGDGPLLERYVDQGGDVGEAAFAALVERHGPMVMRVCRGVLRETHDADDAFQATFLILARKASSIRKRGSVASWLYGVARRVAVRARAERARRIEVERRGAAMAGDEARGTRPMGVGPELHEEVDRLPEKYRSAVVLCDLAGLTHEEAAGQLGVPVGTVKVRLMRARGRLRGRLVRRGLAPGLVAAIAAGRAAAMPAPLVESTVQAAMRIAAGRAAAVSGPIAALVEGVLRAMLYARLKTLAALLTASLSLVVVSMIALPRPAHSVPVPDQPEPPPQAPAPPKVEERGPQTVAVETLKKSNFDQTTSQPGSVLPFASVGLYPGASGMLKSLEVDIGDAVKRGQELAVVDVPEVRAELERSQALVAQAEAQGLKALSGRNVAKAAVAASEAQVKLAEASSKEAEAKRTYRESEVERYKKLGASKSIERALVDQEVNRLHEAMAYEVESQARVKTAQAELETVRAKLKEAEAERQAARRAFASPWRSSNGPRNARPRPRSARRWTAS